MRHLNAPTVGAHAQLFSACKLLWRDTVPQIIIRKDIVKSLNVRNYCFTTFLLYTSSCIAYMNPTYFASPVKLHILVLILGTHAQRGLQSS